jgi:hypothetical protein
MTSVPKYNRREASTRDGRNWRNHDSDAIELTLPIEGETFRWSLVPIPIMR